jgi:potassium/hydrogen antiporter
VGRRLREIELPRDALVSVVIRGTKAIAPRGSTCLQMGDHLHILVQRDTAGEVEELIGRWRGVAARSAPE